MVTWAMGSVSKSDANAGDGAAESLGCRGAGGLQFSLAGAGGVEFGGEMGTVLVEQAAIGLFGLPGKRAQPHLEPGQGVIEPARGLLKAHGLWGFVRHGDSPLRRTVSATINPCGAAPKAWPCLTPGAVECKAAEIA